MAFPTETDLVGDPPSLAGLQCEEFFCQAFVYEGEVVEAANGVHMCFEGLWFRLFFDCGIIFWKPSERPEPWQVEEEGWLYPLDDIGLSLGLSGKRLDHYTMDVSGAEADVTFVFKGGPTIIFENRDDKTTYRLLGAD